MMICYVASYKFDGRYAESSVNWVEVGVQGDLLACD